MANPSKTKPIQDILLKNKERLVEFLTRFHNDRTGKDWIDERGLTSNSWTLRPGYWRLLLSPKYSDGTTRV